MAQVIGTINNLDGSFFIKNEEGEISIVEAGDTIYAGDLVLGSNSNNNSNFLNVTLSDDSKVIKLTANEQQLFDETMLSFELDTDSVIQYNELTESLLLEESPIVEVSPTNTSNSEATLTLEDIENLDATAAGEELTDSEVLNARFENRTASEVDVNTELNSASIVGTGTDEEILVLDGSKNATFTFSGDTTVVEGTSTATISGSIDLTPNETSLVITLSNGATITFDIGYVPGTPVESTPFLITNTDDVYIDPETNILTVDSSLGGGFDTVDSIDSATLNIIDDSDTVTVKLSSNLSAGEDGGSIVYTASLVNSNGFNIEAKEPITITLVNGEIITIPIGAITGSADAIEVNTDDVYIETDLVTNSISTITGGESYENLQVDTTEAVVNIVDDVDTVKVNLSVTPVTLTEDGGTLTYTATIEGTDTPVSDVVLTFNDLLGNPKTIAIEADTLGGMTQTVVPESEFEDILAEPDLVLDVSSVNLSANQGGYENLILGTVTANVTITDTIDTATVKLVALEPVFGEDGTVTSYKEVIGNNVSESGSAYYKTVLVDDNDNIIFNSGKVEVEITNGSATGVVFSSTPYANDGSEDFVNDTQIVTLGEVFSIKTIDDYLVETNQDETFTVGLKDGTFSNSSDYENIVISTTAVVTTITDEIVPDVEDTVTVKLIAVEPVFEDEEETTIISYTEVIEDHIVEESSPVYYKAVLVDSKGNIISDDGEVQVELTDINATGILEASVSNVSDGSEDYVNDTLTVTLGEVFSINTLDDYLVEKNPNEQFNISLKDDTFTNASNYENVLINKQVITTTIVDEEPGVEDTVTISIVSTDALGNILPNSIIGENSTAYYKLVAKDPNGNIIEDAVGSADVIFTDATALRTGTIGEGTFDFNASNILGQSLNTVFSAEVLDDNFKEGLETFNVTISNPIASLYENVEIDTGEITTIIYDDSDATTVILTTNNVAETGSEVVFEIQLSNAPEGGAGTATVQVDGETGTRTVAIDGTGYGIFTVAFSDDDVYNDADSISATVMNVTGNFENLDYTDAGATSTITEVSDTTVLTIDEVLNSDGTYTYTASVTNTPDTDLVITLNNSVVLTISNGNTSTNNNLSPSSIQATSITSVSGGNYEDLDVIHSFGQDAILLIDTNNTLENIDLNIGKFDSDNVNTELALTSITLTPEVDVDGFAINIDGNKLTSTDNIGEQNESVYYLKYVNNANIINAIRVDSNGDAISPQEVVFTLTPDSINETYSISLGIYPLDGAAYSLSNIFDESGTIGGNGHSLLFNIDDLYILATATDSSGNSGIIKNNGSFDPYTVNYSTGNGMGVNAANSIDSSEVLHLNFANSTLHTQMLDDLLVDNDQNNDSTINVIDNRLYAQEHEQYLTESIFTFGKWGSGDQASWKAYNGDFLIAEGIKVYSNDNDRLIIKSEVTNIINDKSWTLVDNVLTNNNGTTETAVISYTISTGVINTSITLEVGESFDFNSFNEVQFTSTSGDFAVATMSALLTENIPAENQIINVEVESSDGTNTANGNMQITFDGDSAIVGTEQDEVIDYMPTSSIDAGAGNDTLMLDEIGSIDFGTLSNNVTNVESIDMTNGIANTLNSLSLSDVIDVVGTETELKIFGDSTDQVDLDSSWLLDPSQDTITDPGITYNVYSQLDTDSGNTYKLLIQDDVTVI